MEGLSKNGINNILVEAMRIHVVALGRSKIVKTSLKGMNSVPNLTGIKETNYL